MAWRRAMISTDLTDPAYFCIWRDIQSAHTYSTRASLGVDIQLFLIWFVAFWGSPADLYQVGVSHAHGKRKRKAV